MGDDGDGMLLLVDDQLVGVLVRLSSQHGSMAGRWFLEASFGRGLEVTQLAFENLEAAKVWPSGRQVASSTGTAALPSPSAECPWSKGTAVGLMFPSRQLCGP